MEGRVGGSFHKEIARKTIKEGVGFSGGQARQGGGPGGIVLRGHRASGFTMK